MPACLFLDIQPDSSVLFIAGSLSWSTDTDTLTKAFDRFDGFISAEVVREGSGKSKGYGFAYFTSEEFLMQACNAMNDSDLDGRRIQVRKAQEKTEEQRRAEREQRQMGQMGGRYRNPARRRHACPSTS